MGKCKVSEILVLSFIATLLSVTPFLSDSTRSTHLYLIINLLIVALGAEAGLLSSSSSSSSEPCSYQQNTRPVDHESISVCSKLRVLKNLSLEKINGGVEGVAMGVKKWNLSLEKINGGVEGVAMGVKKWNLSLEKINGGVEEVVMEVKKWVSSKPVIFFIGSGETEGEEEEDEEIEVGSDGEEDDNGGEELNIKADSFISDFYKQLKMQKGGVLEGISLLA